MKIKNFKQSAIFLIFFVCVALSTANASQNCSIIWWGDFNGSDATSETKKTQQAAMETFEGIQWDQPIGCSEVSDGIVCYCDSSPHWDNRLQCYYFNCTVWYAPYPWARIVIAEDNRQVCLNGSWNQDWWRPDGSGTHTGSWDVVCEPTLVELSSLAATPSNQRTTIHWSTESELDNAGFNLYRSETENGDYAKINTSLIPAKGSSTQGANYEFIDNDVKNRKTYYYNLEDIDLNGKSTMHGPVSATPRLIYGMGKQ